MTATIGNPLGVTDKRFTEGTAAQPITSPQTFADDAALNTALQTADSTTYTDAYLSHMTYNDKVYALRLANDSAGI